jgi:hypothetical protein
MRRRRGEEEMERARGLRGSGSAMKDGDVELTMDNDM